MLPTKLNESFKKPLEERKKNKSHGRSLNVVDLYKSEVMSTALERMKQWVKTQKSQHAGEKRFMKKKEKGKALIVDDQHLSQKMLAMLLSEMGIKVVVANDGKEAVERFDGTQKFIFMDFYMPNMNGDEATKAIRQKEKQLNIKKTAYIVGMTANNVEEIKQICLEAGMNNVVPRPIKYELVEKLVEEYFKN